METNPTRVCELIVGLPAVRVLGVEDVAGEPLAVHVETRGPRPVCPACGGGVWFKDVDVVVLVDLPAFGRPTRLLWHKRRWTCPSSSGRVVHRAGTDDRPYSRGVDGSGGSLGDDSGRPIGPSGFRCGWRAGL